MKENPSGKQGGFESMEHDNMREPMVSHQSETTPRSVAEDWQAGVYEMKHEAMDEAYGLALFWVWSEFFVSEVLLESVDDFLHAHSR